LVNTAPAPHHADTTNTMDFNGLKDQVSNLTLYDLKAGFRKAQNGISAR
jgi:hypothetical protein